VKNPEPIYNAALDYLGKLSMFAVQCVGQPAKSADKRLIWNFMTERLGVSSSADFVVYQGYTLPSNLASRTDLFLPTAAPLEHQSHYLNLLGLVRSTRVVLSPLKTTYTDPQILRFFHRFAIRFLESRKLKPDLADTLQKKAGNFP